jgi:hypothetical protein
LLGDCFEKTEGLPIALKKRVKVAICYYMTIAVVAVAQFHKKCPNPEWLPFTKKLAYWYEKNFRLLSRI